MDVNCCNCGEPWDQYYLRHELTDDELVYSEEGNDWIFGDNRLHVKKCPCCKENAQESTTPLRDRLNAQKRNDQMAILSDCLGDDLDGIASMAGDFDFVDDIDDI